MTILLKTKKLNTYNSQQYLFKHYINHRIGMLLVFLLILIMKTQKNLQVKLAPPWYNFLGFTPRDDYG